MNKKNCLILGSNSDVGQATAYLFAKNSFNIYLAARDVNNYQKRLASDISIRSDVKVENVFFDASQFETHHNFYESLSEKPDVVVSVFGYLGDNDKAIGDFDETLKILTSNLTGHISILNLIANDMEKKGKGTVIGVSSVAGERGRKSNIIYGCAKAGFTQYLSGLRGRLFSTGVHVITIIPGFINSKMIKGLKTPKKLTAQPEQVAKAIFKAYDKKQNVVYVLKPWRLIMLIIKLIPESIFKKLSL